MHLKPTGFLPLITSLLLLYACGGEGDKDRGVTATAEANRIPTAAVTEAASESQSASETLLEETAQADAEQYGRAATCLVDGDITEDGYDLAEVEALFAPLGLGFEPAIGTLEFVASLEVDGEVVSPPQTIVSVYDPNYAGETVALKRVSGGERSCYVPTR